MTNREIATIAESGFLAATAHSLPAEHLYKFVRFKRDVKRAYEQLGRAQRDFMAEVGIKLEDVRSNVSIPEDKATRFNALNDAMLAEEADVRVVRIPMALYKGIYDENKTERGDLFANLDLEILILDNLFVEDETNDV